MPISWETLVFCARVWRKTEKRGCVDMPRVLVVNGDCVLWIVQGARESGPQGAALWLLRPGRYSVPES